jgi:AcrR family transcriptional regulator
MPSSPARSARKRRTETSKGELGRSCAADASPRRRRFEVDLLECAARLFAQRGYAGTTLRDIADELQMSRSSLYNYVAGKEELLQRLATDYINHDAHSIEDILRQDELDPAEKLEAMVKQIVMGIAERPSLTTLFEYHRDTLPDDIRHSIDQLRRRITSQLVLVIQDGVRNGVYIVDDEQIASFVIGNIAAGSVRWVQPNDNIEAVATKVARMAVRSLQRPAMTDELPRTLDTAISRLREDVEILDGLLGSR